MSESLVLNHFKYFNSLQNRIVLAVFDYVSTFKKKKRFSLHSDKLRTSTKDIREGEVREILHRFLVSDNSIGHFRVALNLILKARLSAKFFT